MVKMALGYRAMCYIGARRLKFSLGKYIFICKCMDACFLA